VYVWAPRTLAHLTPSDWQSLPEIVNRLVSEGLEVVAYHHDQPWLDVNDEDDRARAEALLRDDPVAFGIDPEWIVP
jgi:NDP-sugar pyrophosphorylase family protein